MYIASWNTPLQNVERSIVGCEGDRHRKKEISLVSFQMDHCPLKHLFLLSEALGPIVFQQHSFFFFCLDFSKHASPGVWKIK